MLELTLLKEELENLSSLEASAFIFSKLRSVGFDLLRELKAYNDPYGNYTEFTQEEV
jgi:hypothetical protein